MTAMVTACVDYLLLTLIEPRYKLILLFSSVTCCQKLNIWYVTLQEFDEYMNLVLDDAEEDNIKNTRKSLGRILLKGDNITLMMNTYVLSLSLCACP
ncbi:Small nuclear ribonucleoprotein E [Melia azedarach]|uniref:Small nuclear ribonucleoprotein E n=1 Tax=Melia azedarach TaxID=155640 RepID=A0ACC1Y5R1_MELAZ|nr:Small nuclear ribonucleoprotein E [Melia azedarach]